MLLDLRIISSDYNGRATILTIVTIPERVLCLALSTLDVVVCRL